MRSERYGSSRGHPRFRKDGNFTPGFMIPDITKDLANFLIAALEREAPKAEEIHILRTNDAYGKRIFMCAVTTT